MSDLQSMMAASAWRQLVERRRRRNRARKITLALLGSITVTLLVVTALHADRIARWEPLTIREILLTNNRIVEREEVLDLLGIRPGDPWWRYDPDAIDRRVESHSRISSLRLRYAWFHQLRVRVEEREPALLVLGEPDAELTRDGWHLPVRSMVRGWDLPILRLPPGILPEHGRPAPLRPAAVARLIGNLRHERPDLWRQISEIELREECARVYLRSHHGMIVYLPGLHEELWQQVPAVLEDLQQRDRQDVVLDLRFTGKIVVHLPESCVADTLNPSNPRDKV